MTTPENIPTPAPAAPSNNPLNKISPELKRKIGYTLGGIVLLGFAWYLVDMWMHEETDNAYVTGHLHYVSSRVTGTVREVLAEDNQLVKKGDLLVKLDPADYQALFDEAKAEYERAKADFDRVNALAGTKAMSQQDLDHSKDALDVAKARMDTAQLQLSYTTITAPSDGRVGRKNVETGNRVQIGQSLLAVVEEDAWVVANFKETQIAHMKVGQSVSLSVDSIPGKDFVGIIDSFSPASGNQFALLPADNSTGNFTKIVQRIPVKIRFDPESIKGHENDIRVGLSVIVRVRIH